MVSLVAQILHRTLALGTYAGRPFVASERSDNLRFWLDGLRQHVAMLSQEIDRASAALGQAPSVPSEWTDLDRALFHEFLARHYPNESERSHVALGEAWLDGRRVEREVVSSQGTG